MKTCFSKLWGGVIKAIFSHRLHSAWPPPTRGVEIEGKRIMGASIGDITSQSHIPSLQSPCERDWNSPSSWKSWRASWYFARKRNENSFSSVLFSVKGLKIFGDILSIRPFVLPTMKPQSGFSTLFIVNTPLRNIWCMCGVTKQSAYKWSGSYSKSTSVFLLCFASCQHVFICFDRERARAILLPWVLF